MADFNVQLTDPQGRGTNPVSPVEQKVVNTSPMNIISEVGSIFAKGLEHNTKQAALDRKNAVIGEYINAQKVYDDALTTGQWNASQNSTASRANYTKFIAAYPEYAEDFQKARTAFYGGSETGEAEKKLDAEKKQREQDISSASAQGFTFYPGMSDDAQSKTLDAFKRAKRLEIETQQQYAANSEARAQAGEKRAGTQFQMTVDDYVAKEKAFTGAREVAAANFDVVASTFKDLQDKIAHGMPYDQALMIHTGNINRIKAGLNAIAGKNPEAAAPWSKLFDDMDDTARKLLDPKTKSADELQLLKDRFERLTTTAKIAAVETNPRLLNAVVGSQLFPGEQFITTLGASPVVKDWVFSTILGEKPQQVVGTPDDANVFKTAKDAVKRLQTGNYTPEDKLKATQEATKLMNNLLEQTTTAGGEMNPAALKQASTFFASPEFGRMALAGQVDKQTAANAQHVFQTQYEPAVKNAVIRKLEDANVAKTVEIKMVGNTVTVIPKKTNVGAMEALSNFSIDRGMDGVEGMVGQKALKEAEAGLNQLVRLHAHLEGTTDYATYWEKHKHEFMPTIYPAPERLKQGESIEWNGNKWTYNGGNYYDRSNWTQQPASKSTRAK